MRPYMTNEECLNSLDPICKEEFSGKVTGCLSNGIRKFLEKNPNVKLEGFDQTHVYSDIAYNKNISDESKQKIYIAAGKLYDTTSQTYGELSVLSRFKESMKQPIDKFLYESLSAICPDNLIHPLFCDMHKRCANAIVAICLLYSCHTPLSSVMNPANAAQPNHAPRPLCKKVSISDLSVNSRESSRRTSRAVSPAKSSHSEFSFSM